MSAARIRAANSGVPANAIRIGVQPQLRSDISKPGAKQQLRLTATTAILPSSRHFGALLELCSNAILFELRQVFDEYLPFQMIHLVLNARCQQLIGLQHEGFALAVQRSHLDMGETLYLIVNTGDREATLFALRGAGTFDNFRVDENLQVSAVFAFVNDNHPEVHVHLRSSEPDTGRGIHGVCHVIYQLTNVRADDFNLLSHRVEPLIRVYQNLSNRHDCLLIEQITCRIYQTT